jgi:hypothetical protein
MNQLSQHTQSDFRHDVVMSIDQYVQHCYELFCEEN